jgi:hypothetical protein
MQTRRNALAFLGLAGAASAAVNVDAAAAPLDDPQAGKYPQLGRVDPERVAQALDRLAAGLRSGHVVLDGDRPLQIQSSIAYDHWLNQELTLTFYVTDPDTPVG